MARTAITISVAPGTYAAAGALLTWTDADSSNGNSFVMSGNDLLLVRNAHGSSAKTVTINSAADEQGRTKDITAESLAAGVVRCFGPFRNTLGWAQATGVCHCTGEDNNIKFAVIRMPNE